jgi:hypothetical protein
MRKYLGLLAVAVLIIAALALSSCSGSGGRAITWLPTPGGYYLPFIEGCDTGQWPLIYDDTALRYGWFDVTDDLGSFDETSGGGMAIPAGAYVTSFPPAYDTTGDGNPDYFFVGMRGLASYAAENDVYTGGMLSEPAKIGGAWYYPDELVFDPYIVLFIPISQNLANGTSVAIYRFYGYYAVATEQNAGYWSYVGMGSVDDDPLSLGTKVVVFNWSGSLGQFAAVVEVHSGGSGS